MFWQRINAHSAQQRWIATAIIAAIYSLKFNCQSFVAQISMQLAAVVVMRHVCAWHMAYTWLCVIAYTNEVAYTQWCAEKCIRVELKCKNWFQAVEKCRKFYFL